MNEEKILTTIGCFIFIKNKICLFLSVISSCLLYLFYKQDLTYTIIGFVFLFSLFCFIKELFMFLKKEIQKIKENKKEKSEQYNEIEKMMKKVIQTLNNKNNIELFKKSLTNNVFLSNEETNYGLFLALNKLNVFDGFYSNEILKVDNVKGGIEFHVNPIFVLDINKFFRKYKNNFMKFVFSQYPNDETECDMEDIKEQNIENKDANMKELIKTAIIEANIEMQKPQIIEYEKISNKEKIKRILCLIFCQKKLNYNPDLPFAMLQMLSGDMLSIFKWFLYIVAGIFGLAFLGGLINFSVQELSAYVLFLGIAIMTLLIGKILNKTKDVILKYQYDKNITLGLFSAFIAILSLVIALISLLK